MKHFNFLIASFLLVGWCNAQVLHVIASSKIAVSAPAEYVKINFTWTAYGIATWNDVYPADPFGTSNWAAGYVAFNDLTKSDGSASTIDISNGANWYGYANTNSSGNSSGVFPDAVTERAWLYDNGATINITGLTNATQYKIYCLFVDSDTEPQSFSVGATNSNIVNPNNNYGNNSTYTDWETDPSLASLTFTSSGTSATITFNVTVGGGNFKGSISAMVVKKL